MDEMRELLNNLQSLTGKIKDDQEAREAKKVPIGTVPDHIKKEFDRIQEIHKEMQALLQEADSRKDLAWSQIKLMVGPGYESLEYDVDTQLIMGTPDTPDTPPKIKE